MTDTVAEAIRNTPIDYLKKTLETRNPGPLAQGSQFFTEQDPVTLAKTKWVPYNHPSIQAPARGFMANIPGRVGVVKIDRFVGGVIDLVPSRKGADYLDAVMRVPKHRLFEYMPIVQFTVALVGPDDGGKDILWTVFPGDPIPPSAVTAGTRVEKGRITLAEAKELGIEYAKLEAEE